MVVQSIALPNASGIPRDEELAASPAEVLAPPAAVGRSFHGPLLLPLLAVAQIAWLGLLAYGAFRVFI